MFFQKCAPGFYRDGSGLYLGLCVPCECNGRADECEDRTGRCLVRNTLNPKPKYQQGMAIQDPAVTVPCSFWLLLRLSISVPRLETLSDTVSWPPVAGPPACLFFLVLSVLYAFLHLSHLCYVIVQETQDQACVCNACVNPHPRCSKPSGHKLLRRELISDGLTGGKVFLHKDLLGMHILLLTQRFILCRMALY